MSLEDTSSWEIAEDEGENEYEEEVLASEESIFIGDYASAVEGAIQAVGSNEDNNTTCNIWNLSWEYEANTCVVVLTPPILWETTPDIDVWTTDYDIYINWSKIDLKKKSIKFNIKWKQYSDWKKYNIYHLNPIYETEISLLDSFSSLELRK